MPSRPSPREDSLLFYVRFKGASTGCAIKAIQALYARKTFARLENVPVSELITVSKKPSPGVNYVPESRWKRGMSSVGSKPGVVKAAKLEMGFMTDPRCCATCGNCDERKAPPHPMRPEQVNYHRRCIEGDFSVHGENSCDRWTPRSRARQIGEAAPTGPDPLDQKVLRLIAEQLRRPEEAIGPDTRWADVSDSLDHVEIMMAIEDQFSILIPYEAAVNMRTIGDTLIYLHKSKKK